MTAPDFSIVVRGTPSPQGSKSHKGKGVMVESSAGVKPWREAVKNAAVSAIEHTDGWQPLDGPLAVALTITTGWQPTSRPVWWPKGVPCPKGTRWRPASAPDLSKLLRATEDALTDAGAWRDDARVVEYRRLAKHFIGDDAADVLTTGPGAVIHIWRLVPPRPQTRSDQLPEPDRQELQP